MFENIHLLYRFYGGWKGIVSSSYFWTAVGISFVVGVIFDFGAWYEIVRDILPSLAGFSIAAFAITFVVLTRSQLEALLKAKKDDDVPPLVAIAGAIGHAVIVQVCTMIAAAIAIFINHQVGKDICFEIFAIQDGIKVIGCVGYMINYLGYFMLFYSLLLVLAAALSVFRMIVVVSGVR